MQHQLLKGRDISAGTALGYGLDDRGSRVRFPAGAGNFSLHHRVQNGSGAHPPSYPTGTRRSFPGVKRPGPEADHSPPSSAEVKWWVELYFHSPNTPSWRGAQLKHRDNCTLPYLYINCLSIWDAGSDVLFLLLDDWSSILSRCRDIFALRYRVQTGSGAHPFSYLMGTRGLFLRG
jgi:hypothetical protein